jgi:hypothetical protein
MSAVARKKKATRNTKSKFPIACKTWEEVEQIKKKYCTPTGKGPKGQLCYDLEEVSRYAIFPKD